MTNSFFGGMPQQKGVAPQAAPSGTNSLNSDIDPVKRAKFTGYLQGISENTVPPQQPQPPMMPPGMGMPPHGIMPPMQPPMMPQQPPMMPPRPMNMGGMVDVFDPRYMNQGGFVISTDDSGKIRTRPVFDENKGRMVSQILSRDMVDEMEKAAMAKANQPKPAPPPIVVEPESTLVAINKILEDDYESGKGFAETMQPVTTKPTISLPAPKPILSDTDVKGPRRSGIDLPVTKPIQLPVSKPRGDEPVFRTMLKDFYSDRHGGSGAIDDILTGDKFDLTNRDELNAADMIKRMLSEGEKISGPDTETFDVPRANVRGKYPFELTDEQLFLIDSLMPEQTLDAMNENMPDRFSGEEEEEGLGLLAQFLNLFRPRYNRMGFGEELGVDRRPFLNQDSTQFNDGGIVQGFRAGGVAKDRYEDFSSNISGNVGGRVDIRDIDDLGTEERVIKDIDDLGSATPIFKTTSTPRDTSDDDLRRDEDKVESINPMYEDFKKSQESMFAPFVNKLGSFMGYDDPFDLYKATQATDAAYFEGQKDRKRDQDRAAAKLAEEQRLRDMIQGMLPPTADPTQGGIGGMPTTPAPDAPVADPVEPDYGSVVVESDRVPGFDVGNISPYPQFRMPTEYTPIFPTSLSANYFKDLFKNMGVKNMQQGGSVNQLDSAIDNFINAYR